MNIWFCIAFSIFIIIIIVLLIKRYWMEKSLQQITIDLKSILESDTNNLLTTSLLINKKIKSLIKNLNEALMELRKQRLQYENGNQELKKSVANISHDLRTPLTVISGYMDLLKKEKTNEKQKSYINIIDKKTNELIFLTNQLSDYSKCIDIGKNITKEQCCMNDILEEVLASYYNMFNEKNMKPEVIICEKKIYRNINKNMLIRIFENLISNILKYGENECKIELDNCGIITFLNKTNNVDETTIKKVFDRYYTLENIKKNTGLGLSIAKQLIELNNGTVVAKYIKSYFIVQIEFR